MYTTTEEILEYTSKKKMSEISITLLELVLLVALTTSGELTKLDITQGIDLTWLMAKWVTKKVNHEALKAVGVFKQLFRIAE